MDSFQKMAMEGSRDGRHPCIDGCRPERAGKGAIRIYGIEPGHSLKQQKSKVSVEPGYRVEQQLGWRFNQGIFKLFATLAGDGPQTTRYMPGTIGFLKTTVTARTLRPTSFRPLRTQLKLGKRSMLG